MINQIHAWFFRPENDWDPVPAAHAEIYSAHEWSHVDESLVSEIDAWMGGLAGKRVIDLGGGPGHYSAALARRGAHVTWHDVSRRYRDLASSRTAGAGLEVRYSLGYLEAAERFASEPFDLVFNRICWNYSMSDSRFAKLLYDLVKPGGYGYVDTDLFRGNTGSLARKVQRLLYDSRIMKIGHPFPRRGVMQSHMRRLPIEIVDKSTATNDRIFFRK
jgi:SAM-dependent methyltransferase